MVMNVALCHRVFGYLIDNRGVFDKIRIMNNNRFKFRVWDIENKKFITWWLSLMDADFELNDLFSYEEFTRQYIIQQYTGLKDKNNKEIYEGDIIRVSRYHITNVPIGPKSFKCDLVEDGVETGYVFCSHPPYEFVVSFEHIRYDDCDKLICNSERNEIVGNIFENPEIVNYE
jgi:uncharacterized phage protein (TIGR01671 family)